MDDIRDKFPEFKALCNSELELVLKLYNDHFNTPFTISNASHYVSGVMILVVCFMFVNAQKLQTPLLDRLGLPDENIDETTTVNHNAP